MRTYGRLYGDQPPPVWAYDLAFPTWTFDGLTVTPGEPDPAGGTSAFLTAPNDAASPVAFGPGIALPQGASATYTLQTLPSGSVWVSFVVDYLEASGTPLFSDTLSYNYVTGVYDNSGATHGAALVVLQNAQGWYQATISLPGTYRGGVVGTQLEYWPVGIAPYTNLSASAYVYQDLYNLTPSNWVEITTDANGFNDNVYLTTLAQILKLNLGESPFWANYGIPQYQTIMTQVFPDYYAMQTQTQMAPYFASLIINRVPQSFPPVYTVTAVTHSGAVLNSSIPA